MIHNCSSVNNLYNKINIDKLEKIIWRFEGDKLYVWISGTLENILGECKLELMEHLVSYLHPQCTFDRYFKIRDVTWDQIARSPVMRFVNMQRHLHDVTVLPRTTFVVAFHKLMTNFSFGPCCSQINEQRV